MSGRKPKAFSQPRFHARQFRVGVDQGLFRIDRGQRHVQLHVIPASLLDGRGIGRNAAAFSQRKFHLARTPPADELPRGIRARWSGPTASHSRESEAEPGTTIRPGDFNRPIGVAGVTDKSQSIRNGELSSVR